MKQLVIFLVCILIFSGTLHSKDYWEKVNVPNDSPTKELAIDSSGNLYTCFLGMYKSTDDGTSWNVIDEVTAQGQTVKLSRTKLIIQSIAIAKNGYLFSSMSDGGVFRSIDGGNSWGLIQDTMENIQDFIACSNGRIFANRTYDLYFSDDSGSSWSRCEFWEDTHLGNSRTRMALSPSGKLFASNKGVWVIDTASLAYNYYTDGLDSSWIRCFAFGNGKVFAGTDTSGVYVSADDGQTWNRLNNSPKTVSITSMVYTKNGKLIAGSEDGGIYISADDGLTWTKSTASFADYSINDIDIYNEKIYVCSNGIFTSKDDGENWTVIADNPGFPMITSYDINSNGKIFAMSLIGLYSSTDKGNSWSFNPMNGINIDYMNGVLLDKNDKLYIWSSYLDYFLFSSDDGTTWENVPGFENTRTYDLKENSLGHLYLANGQGLSSNLYVSKNDGQSWEKLLDNFNSAVINLGENDEIIYTEDVTVYYSTDYGITWIPKTCMDLAGEFYGQKIEMDGDFIWISYPKSGVIESNDRGNIWRLINDGLTGDDFVGEFQFNDINKISNTLYAGLDYGLFTYDFDNRTWILSDSGIIASPTSHVNYLKDKHIYATTTTGVYRTVDSVVSVEEYPQINNESNLTVYPNPFMDKIVLEIAGNNEKMTINICDLFGKTIQTIQTGLLNEGIIHKIHLNTESLTPGVYFINVPVAHLAKMVIKN
ncbi:MAG: T9SS type A sorting domain-containing protein [Ignavibacteriae bacterium]|nr:T9SS type A sorting domain-containing protein [Ignavibacteriota bacterium]